MLRLRLQRIGTTRRESRDGTTKVETLLVFAGAQVSERDIGLLNHLQHEAGVLLRVHAIQQPLLKPEIAMPNGKRRGRPRRSSPQTELPGT